MQRRTARHAMIAASGLVPAFQTSYRMYTDQDLDAAVQAGVLNAHTADALRAFLQTARSGALPATPTPAPDEEHFRLVTGFNDIFVVIACALLLVSVGWIVRTFAGSATGLLASAAASWGLAEFFTRKRHMALPSIVLLGSFAGCLLGAGIMLTDKWALGIVAAALVTALGVWLHWRRFRVPISVAVGVAAAVGSAVATLVAAVPQAWGWSLLVFTIAGLLVFSLAMRWDSSDTRRETGRSDVAFWLHLLAAPLLVHPVFSLLGVYSNSTIGGGDPETAVFSSAVTAIAVGVLYALIAVVSLAIDRRALMVSALAYVFYAFGTLFQSYGMVSLGFALTALLIGSGLLMLSAFWQTSRGVVLGMLPASLRARLPLPR